MSRNILLLLLLLLVAGEVERRSTFRFDGAADGGKTRNEIHYEEIRNQRFCNEEENKIVLQ